MRVFGSLFASLLFASAMLLMTSCAQSTTTTSSDSGAPDSGTEVSKATSTATEKPEVTKVAANTTTATTAAAQDEEWGTIKGRIIIKGDAPKVAAIDPMGKDADVCGADENMMPRGIVVGEDGGLKNAFLFLYMSRSDTQEPEVHPSYKESAEEKVTVDNLNCMFEPHCTFIRTAQTLVAKNSDSKGHNIQNTSRVNPFNPLIAPLKSEEIEMEGPERLPTELKCSIHPWMKAYMIVRDEPYVAITGEDGKFEIKNMPEGEWNFTFWHERCGYMADLQKDGENVLEDRPAIVTWNVKKGETIDLGDLTIDVASLKGD